MKFETCPWKKDDPHVVSMHCGETLIVKILDDCGKEVSQLVVGTLRLPDGFVGASVTLPTPHYRSQRDSYVLLGGIEADELVFWKGEEMAELRLERVL